MTRLLTLAVVAMIVAGCASPVTGVGEPGTPVTAPPDGRVVFEVTSGGGLEPYGIALARRPALAVYGDGRAFVPMENRTFTGAPIGITPGSVAPRTLRTLMADAQGSRLFDDADFGTPHVTDLGYTTVTFRPDGDRVLHASAYALDYRDGDDQLSTTQRLHRRALRRLIAALSNAVHVGEVGEYLPTRVDVTAPAGVPTGGRHPQWPGPALTGKLDRRRLDARCGVLSGATARRVYLAARDNSSIDWTVNGRPRALVVRALLPGERGCR